MAFARTRSRSRIMWRGFSVAAMTEGVPGTCDVSILVRGSSFGLLVFDQAESAHDFLLFNHHRAMQWSHPKMQGDLPPLCRAHSATLVGRKIVTIGGGEGASYYHSVYVFDIPTRRWPCLTSTTPDVPPPRHGHIMMLYWNKSWVFGDGNGLQVLNDVWTLDVRVGSSLDRMRWEQVTKWTHKRPSLCGYHMANLVRNIMFVVGGSDGRKCLQDHR